MTPNSTLCYMPCMSFGTAQMCPPLLIGETCAFSRFPLWLDPNWLICQIVTQCRRKYATSSLPHPTLVVKCVSSYRVGWMLAVDDNYYDILKQKRRLSSDLFLKFLKMSNGKNWDHHFKNFCKERRRKTLTKALAWVFAKCKYFPRRRKECVNMAVQVVDWWWPSGL